MADQNANPRGGKPQQQQQQKVECPRCGLETTKGMARCGHCGKALRVDCPSCGLNVPNFPKCPQCGKPTEKDAKGKKEEKRAVIRVEVSHTGSAGNHRLAIQVTKDGKALKQARIWVGTGKTSRVLVADDRGFKEYDCVFTCRKMPVVVRVEGTQSNTQEFVLDGPPFSFTPQRGMTRWQAFCARLAASRKWNRGE